MKKVLLHICCGVCAIASIKRLQEEGYGVVGFFYNPNIEPKEEYLKRLETAKKAARITGIEFIEGDYENLEWREAVKGLEMEPENGKRCLSCYKARLARAWQEAKKQNCVYYTSTLTISPHKNSKVIFEIAKEAGGEDFLAIDFKKKDGFKKANELAKENDLYRQVYCGCIYSIRVSNG